MDDQAFVYATLATIVGCLALHVVRRTFDPFAPLWLFLFGFGLVYVVQAIQYREWALSARGVDLVTAANFRAFWGLLWFLFVYHLPIGRALAPRLPKPPARWSSTLVATIAPPLVIWGLISSGHMLRVEADSPHASISAEGFLLRSFAAVMLVAGILLIVTGRNPAHPRPVFTWTGLAVVASYILIWIYNGKRSHPIFAVLSGVCAYYVARGKRPSWAVLSATACAGVVFVAVAIGWRNNPNYESSVSGFTEFLGDFSVETVLKGMNMSEDDPSKPTSHETEEYGGFLLMMDTVPTRSDYDYGAPYLRIVSTFIPRILWPDKPIYGREQWINAWIAGSELPRDSTFTGPAIGILGATQLNGGAVGTFVVLGAIAALLRLAYEYFRHNEHAPWVQAAWSLTYYNAWFMTVNDDPFIWFYYNWGFTIMPFLALLWLINAWARKGTGERLTDVSWVPDAVVPATTST